MWEVVGTPIEAIADGTDVKVEIVYDGQDQVHTVSPLTAGQR